MPDKASLTICGIEDQDYKEEKIDWWDRVWGFDMSCIHKLTMLEPLVDCVNDNAIVTNRCEFIVSSSK
jgi:type I protein arginine methyltransferase